MADELAVHAVGDFAPSTTTAPEPIREAPSSAATAAYSPASFAAPRR